MHVAVTYNLKPDSVAARRGVPDDTYAEWDEPATIAAVYQALAAEHHVTLIEADQTGERQLFALQPDLVFNLAEGVRGANREAHLPALLEQWHLPFTGSSACTLQHCLDKAATKQILLHHGLPTPAYCVAYTANDICPPGHFPLIVKPLYEGSSKGVYGASVVHTRKQLREQVYHVLATYQQPALIETFLPGREFTVALLGNAPDLTVLPIVEICFAALPAGAPAVYSYEAKWLWDSPTHPLALLQCPAPLSPTLAHTVSDLCRQAFVALTCRDWCRIDVRLDAYGQPHILELNPLPGIVPDPDSHSCFPYAAATANIAYPELIRRVLAHACRRYGLPATMRSR